MFCQKLDIKGMGSMNRRGKYEQSPNQNPPYINYEEKLLVVNVYMIIGSWNSGNGR